MDRTLVIVKPDGVERGLAGEIVSRLERKQLRLVAAELRTISEETARTHYAEHSERPFFAALVTFITRSPSLILVVEGPEDTYAVVRRMMGVTNPAEAASGTIRGDFSEDHGHAPRNDTPRSDTAPRRDTTPVLEPAVVDPISVP